MKRIRVAIDGPVSSGKSTVGSRVAERLGYLFIDTGLMYRAIAYRIKKENLNEEAWGDAAAASRFEWKGDRHRPDLFMNGESLAGKLSTPEIAAFTSQVAVRSEVRRALVDFQRGMAEGGGVVMVGRDIGSVVLPDAELKIFLTASLDARVERRYEELCHAGVSISREKLRSEVIERDERDSRRRDSPLRLAPGGVGVNTTNLTIEEVVEQIVSLARVKER